MIAQPEPYQRALALGLLPILEFSALMPEPAIVQDLDLAGLEVELLVERRVVDDCSEPRGGDSSSHIGGSGP